MPKLSERVNQNFVKLLFVGTSGTGKTGALTSLVAADYKVRIIDMDNGLSALISHVQQTCPDKINNVEFITLRDQYKATTRGVQVPNAKAVIDAFKLLDTWEDGSSPDTWGDEYIIVLDSLTALGTAAFHWAKAQNPSTKDPRQWYSAAQNVVEDLVSALTSSDFKTNVIIISHIDIREDKGITKGFVSSIGKALGPKLPRLVDTMVAAETKGQGAKVQRSIKTFPTSLIDLKNPAPMKIAEEYPLETGLAEIFNNLKNL